MADSRITQPVPSRAPRRAGEGINPVVQALQESNRQILEAGRTTAQLQVEAMRSATEGNKMMLAGMNDLASGIAQSGENIRIQKEVERQRQHEMSRDQQAQQAAQKQEQMRQSAQSARQSEVNKISQEYNNARLQQETDFAQARRDETEATRQFAMNFQEMNSAIERMTTGIPEDDPTTPENEATAYVDTNRQIAVEYATKIGRIKTDRDKNTFLKGLAMTASQQMNVAQTAENDALLEKNRAELEKRWEMDVRAKNSAETVQTQLFAQRNSHDLIDKSYEEGLSWQDASQRVLNDLSQSDLSGGADRIGIIKALQRSPGSDQLNQAASKLGPNGWASVDAYMSTVSAYENSLGPADDPKLQKYREGVITALLAQGAMMRSTPTYNALRYGILWSDAVTFWDDYRKRTGRYPQKQEILNHLRDIDISWAPGDFDMKRVFPELMGPPAPGEVRLGISAADAGPALRSTEPSQPPIRAQATGRKAGKAIRRGASRGFREIGDAAAGFLTPAASLGRAVKRGAGITGQMMIGLFGEDSEVPDRKRRPYR